MCNKAPTFYLYICTNIYSVAVNRRRASVYLFVLVLMSIISFLRTFVRLCVKGNQRVSAELKGTRLLLVKEWAVILIFKCYRSECIPRFDSLFLGLPRSTNLSWPSQQQLSLRKPNPRQPDAKWACIQMKRERETAGYMKTSWLSCTPPEATHSVRGPAVTRLYFVWFLSLLHWCLKKKNPKYR